MTPGNPTEVKEIFAAALQLAPEMRAEFLNIACKGNTQLQRTVENLLSAYGRMGDFFEHGGGVSHPEQSPTAGDSTESMPTGSSSGQQLSAGERLGDRFVVVQFLASGGMGEVYEVIDEHLQGK